MSYSKYIPKNERPVITALIKAMLEAGGSVTVNDGVEDILVKATGLNAVTEELGGTGEDYLTVYDKDGERLGFFWLIYNNGSEDDPMIVISDYTANDFCESIYRPISAKYDQ